MNIQEIKDRLASQPFEPFTVVTSDGDRHVVDHPENAKLVRGGILYIFEPQVNGDEAPYERPKAVSLLHVTTVEPSEPRPPRES